MRLAWSPASCLPPAFLSVLCVCVHITSRAGDFQIGCDWGTSPEGQSLLASSVFTGMMLASSAWGVVADLAGRKAAFGAAAGLAASAGFASAFAPTFTWLVVLRLLVGAGLVGVLPMYTLLEEWLPKDSCGKGKWLVALQAWWSVGTVLEGLLALWLLNSYGWRALLAASSIPLGCILLALPLVSESPHYLAASGRMAEAHRVLALAARRNGTSSRLRQHLHFHRNKVDPTLEQHLRMAELPDEEEGLLLLPSPPRRRQVGLPAPVTEGGNVDSPVPAGGGVAAAASGNGFDYVAVDDERPLGREVGVPSAEEAPLEVETAPTTGRSPSSGVYCGRGGGACALCRRCCSGSADGDADGNGAVDGVCCFGKRSGDSGCCCDGDGGAVARAAAVAGWCRELAALGRILLGPELYGRTWRLAISWFACALSYYGVVMLVPWVAAGSLHMRDGGGAAAVATAAAAGSCVPWPSGGGMHLVLPLGAYVSMMGAAAAELPSLAWAFLAVDRWKSRTVVALSLIATAAALAPLVLAQVGGSAAAAENMPALTAPPPPPLHPAADTADGTAGPVAVMRRQMHPAWLTSSASWWLPLASVLLARLFVSGAFTLLYVLTPEQYPSRVRGSALGAANTLARLGALAAPFVAVALPQRGALPGALGLMAVSCGAAALAVWGLRGEGGGEKREGV
ncbi:hypothetical protein VOLCADRAFT_100010 [Volvox carteri f. nagariensis]|uniref:Major facilitator superfamily (MFS) profile domain-containing protein n=1 Tax=Volvox carteri f. nagariensis TaxID=3068 RepID=D8UJ66_VOLCA|nr:uncharacterized protein VOLCADRAFT_100010 [Volvox carteri f. nagariensis]EFJ40218.1 hypothetical protein VOLCADRAFT_100010 [Volvox carteri f. nagariensis]|eukprot:XP_002958698.1 hypothetical protein VOLCADRAFT_100010 [Volvox carteri f. nagariensis]